MTAPLGFVARAALVSALSLAGSLAMAQTNFSLNLGNTCTDIGASPTTMGQKNTGTCGTVDGFATKVTGWAADTTASATASFTQQWVQNYGSGSGLGVKLTSGTGAIETTSPDHAVDNNQQLEGVLLYFGQAITLKQLAVGWASADSDLSLFAYTGSATSSATTAMSGTKVGGATGTSGIGGSWALVGNYANADNPNGSTTTDTPFGVNAGNVSSSWWFVSAYNSKFGGSCTGTDGNASTSCSNTNNTTSSPTDFFKFLSVAGTYGGGNTQQTPEPASIALVSMGLIGALGLRRRRNATHA
ncbi:MAG: PEP-CTERM sorting domain-containing protein [Burkholderiales bacterium]|nr:PEP-CTERM sorting domain-containing protein [Burkholderiales bacterium]